jgi:hypothetical protein
MKKTIILMTLILILASFRVYAADLEVQKIDKGSVIVLESNNPAVFDFIITNNAGDDNFEIYSLIGVAMTPKGFIEIPYGEKKVEVTARVAEELRKEPGYFTFEYELKGRIIGIFKDTLTVQIVPFKDVIELSAMPLHPDATTATIEIKNKENTHLDNVQLEFDSIFFNEVKTISLEPYGETNVTININRQPRVSAGNYMFFAKLAGKGDETKVEGVINYLEKTGTSVERSSSGLVVKKDTIRKTNVGNVPTTATVELKKDIISRLFTINSIEPAKVVRKGFFVTYTWEKSLRPDEVLVVESTTNYTLPVILIALVVIAGIVAWIYSQGSLVLKKRVSFVRTKHGQFALKVTLRVKARKHIDNVQIIDSLPSMTKLYEKFGKMPDRIDSGTRRMFWNIDRLAKGEERVYSYVIYSSLRVVGRFELPAATAVFEKDGKTTEVWSNKAFFASESG